MPNQQSGPPSSHDYSEGIRNPGPDGGILARSLSLERAIEIAELRALALTLEGATIDAVFILESRHTRTADEPGKASPGHALREQFRQLTRAANAERWPEQIEA